MSSTESPTSENGLNLYLTSDDWVDFYGSKQLLSIKRINICIFSYLLVKTKDVLMVNKIPRQEFLLTKRYLYVVRNFMEYLPICFDVYIAERSTDGKIKTGELFATETWLHRR